MEDPPTRNTANLFDGAWGNFSKDLRALIITAACLKALTTTAPCLRVWDELGGGDDKHEDTVITETDANKVQHKLEVINFIFGLAWHNSV